MQIASSKADKIFIVVPPKYTDFANIFYLVLVAKFLEHIGINIHTINLIYDKQLYYRLIYNLDSMKLETMKTYIKTTLPNSFITLSKSLADISILFVCKPENRFYLCVNYQSLNNLIIKN